MSVEMTTPLNDSGAHNYQFKLKLRGCLISMKSHEEMCCGFIETLNAAQFTDEAA